MKSLPSAAAISLCLLAFLSATAKQTDPRDSWRVTALLESRALSVKGEPLGDVEDIVFGDEGQVYEVLVDHDLAVAKSATGPVEEARRQSIHEALFAVRLEGSRFDVHAGTLQLAVDGLENRAALHNALRDRRDEKLPVGRYLGSAIIGATVNLADAERFGEVKDILVDPGAMRASGLVVEVRGLLGADAYVLPPVFSAYDRDSREMNFAVRREEVEARSPASSSSTEGN